MNVTLAWTPGAGSTSQSVQYKLATTTSWTTFSTVSGTTATVNVTGLSDNLIYDFRISTACNGGTTTFSPTVQKINIICPTVTITPASTSLSYSFPEIGGSVTTYAVKLFDCFPKIIGPVTYSYDNNAIQTFEVTFTFRYWVNYFLERSGNIELGSPNFRGVNVKSGAGMFGGILNKLPPELRRAGVDVLQGLKRRIPIGGITGGRVFPPFGNFPPLNL